MHQRRAPLSEIPNSNSIMDQQHPMMMVAKDGSYRSGPAGTTTFRSAGVDSQASTVQCGSQPTAAHGFSQQSNSAYHPTHSSQSQRAYQASVEVHDVDLDDEEVEVQGGSRRPSTTTMMMPTANRVAPPAVDLVEYAEDIISHLHQRERTLLRDPNYLANQPVVTERMRMILIDWLVDVAIKFKVHPETYYLAVDIVDRFLMQNSVARVQLQLVGVTSILLAAKHEEIWAPEIKDCIYISANTYSDQDVIRMERDIACSLGFRFTVPTSYPFMCNMLKRLNANTAVRHATYFFLDSATLDYSMLAYLPSCIAQAACYLGHLLILHQGGTTSGSQAGGWKATFANCCETPMVDLTECAEKLLAFTHVLVAPNSRFQAIRRKYSSSRYSGVAALELPQTAL